MLASCSFYSNQLGQFIPYHRHENLTGRSLQQTLQTVLYWIASSAFLSHTMREQSTGKKLPFFVSEALGLFLPGYKPNCFLRWVCSKASTPLAPSCLVTQDCQSLHLWFSVGWLIHISLPLALANIAHFGEQWYPEERHESLYGGGKGAERQLGPRTAWAGWFCTLRKQAHQDPECTGKFACLPKGRVIHLLPRAEGSDVQFPWIWCSFDSPYGCWVSRTLFPFLVGFMTNVVGRQYLKVCVSPSFVFFFPSTEDDCLTVNTDRELKKKKKKNSALGWLLAREAEEKAYRC